MRTLVWFRNDLRTIDHEALVEAAKNGDVCGLYCFDPRHFEEIDYGFPKTDAYRAQFIIESVEDLRNSFRELGSDLMVRVGKPEEFIPKIVEKMTIDEVAYHGELAPEEKDVEQNVETAVDVPMKKFWGSAMYHRDDLPFDLLTIPDVYTQFRKKVEKKSSVRDPLTEPESLRWDGDIEHGEIPSVADIGLTEQPMDDRSVLQFKGGQSEAWHRLQHYFYEVDELRNYKYKRNGLLGADYSSKFSPWLAHGCISARSIHSEVEKYEKDVHENVSTYWMKFELIWRDYFHYSMIKYGSQLFQLGGIQQKDLKKSTHQATFNKWADGETGIPFIDANMRELNQTGYMSNRGRQNVASFLAQNLNFDWRWGAAYFESKLIDYDVSSNWGNWAYNSTVGHDPRNRYFNIINQAGKYDKKGEYVRHWLPELEELPKEFIHEPWKMTPDQQELYNLKLGSDYPEPMIELEKSYERIRNEG